KSEDYNETGNLEKTMEVLKLGEFEGSATAYQIIAKDVLEGSSTTITFWERRRPDEEISDDTFDAENLDSFDPTVYGLID
ncbi:outer membrane lipoprotein-sorting protein, partial [Candidatus Bipolaricaulota bacterium]|nr:outer membrane lipoprotein-sorting protein [Candidatus Bipolaricaulota bacterium]